MAITIKCLGHASFQITADGQVIYIDPSTLHTGLDAKDFEPADLILVTHAHADHCDPDLLKKILKAGSPIIAPTRCKDSIKKGVVWDLNAGEFMEVLNTDIKVRAVHAYNVSRVRSSGEPFHLKGEGVGFILTLGGKRIYHAGDTDLIPEMDSLSEVDIDVALLPSGDTYTMDIEEASNAAMKINPKVAIPMHLKDANPELFREKVEGGSSTKVVVLRNGEEFTLD